MVRPTCARQLCKCEEIGGRVQESLDFRSFESTDFIDKKKIKKHPVNGKLVNLVFCSVACFEQACDIPGIANVATHMSTLFRETWVERDSRHKTRTLLDKPSPRPSFNFGEEEVVSLKLAVTIVMFDIFFCGTSRDLDKVTWEVQRVTSVVSNWREFAWLVYICRKTYSLDAVTTLLLGPNRLKFDTALEIDSQALSDVCDQVAFGDGILHGEAKGQFVERAVQLRSILHRLPDGFLNGSTEDIREAMRVFSTETDRNKALRKRATKVFTMRNIDSYLNMTVSDRLYHFFTSIGGVNTFHGWQMCLDFPLSMYNKLSLIHI